LEAPLGQKLNLISLDEKKAFQLCRKLGTGLSEPEVAAVIAYFRKLGRDPTNIELQAIAQTWSEHCFHKVFKSKIAIGKQTINGLFHYFIKKATEEIRANWVVSAFSDNAGIVKFEETVSIAAKVETHNHPSAIEPFGGAATGVGGVIRDILGVWAEPIAVTDTLFFGDLNFPFDKLPLGVKHPRYLLSGVVSGVGNYGNNMGIPTVNGGIYFDDAYTGYTLVFCGCVGLLKTRNYAKSAKAGDVLVIAGARTGRDGIHGVNFASEKIEGDTDALRSAVQIPDPIEEEKLMRAVLEIGDRRLASAITDLGGGGLSSGVCETAKNFGCGAQVDLASVPLKTSKIEPWEIWISESQERMLLVVPAESVAKTLSVFEREEVEACAIGRLTESGKIVLKNRDETLGELDLEFLFSPPLPKLLAQIASPSKGKSKTIPHPRKFEKENLTEDLLSLLRSPNIASKERFVRTYDFEVKGNTALKPFGYPGSGPNDAAVLKPLLGSQKGLVISCGYNPRFSALDPYCMAASAIDEAVRNNVAAGGRRIALLDNFAWGNPEDPRTLGGLVQAARACYDVSKAYEMPFISGKDSLYNETPLGEILPTLVITAIGIIPDITKTASADFKIPGDAIYLVGETKPEMGGSEFYHLKKIRSGDVPKSDLEKAPALYRAMNRATDQPFVRAVHDLSQGGLAAAIAEMCLTNILGAEVILPESSADIPPVEQLFSESNSRFLVEVQSGEETKFEKIFKGFACDRIGTVARDVIRIFDQHGTRLIETSTHDSALAWKSGFVTSSAQ
jgi:phosphoribosylformylglycinamidine synthase subunit PurSL